MTETNQPTGGNQEPEKGNEGRNDGVPEIPNLSANAISLLMALIAS